MSDINISISNHDKSSSYISQLTTTSSVKDIHTIRTTASLHRAPVCGSSKVNVRPLEQEHSRLSEIEEKVHEVLLSEISSYNPLELKLIDSSNFEFEFSATRVNLTSSRNC